MSAPSPGRDIDGRARRPGRGRTVPHRHLYRLGRQVTSGEKGPPHRQTAAIGKELVVPEVAVPGRITDGRGRSKTSLEAPDPSPSGRPHRLADKLAPIEWQDNVKTGAAGQYPFGKQDIGAGGERAVGEADIHVSELALDLVPDPRLLVGRKAAGHPRRGDNVPTIVHYPWRSEGCQNRGVQPIGADDQA